MIKINNGSNSPITISNDKSKTTEATVINLDDYTRLNKIISEAITQSEIERVPLHECLSDIEVADGRYTIYDTDKSLLAIVESRGGRHIILPAKGMSRFKNVKLINEGTYSILTQLHILLTGGAE